MPVNVAPIVKDLRSRLQVIYGQRFQGCYLFGSYARGENRPGSDVDILIVLDDYASYSAEIARTSHVISELSLLYNLSLSRVFLRHAEWVSGDNPFLSNVREDAVPA